MATVEIRFKRIHPGAQVPAYQSAEAAGMDLHACVDAPVTLQPGDLLEVSGSLARDGSPLLNATEIKRKDGEELLSSGSRL